MSAIFAVRGRSVFTGYAWGCDGRLFEDRNENKGIGLRARPGPERGSAAGRTTFEWILIYLAA